VSLLLSTLGAVHLLGAAFVFGGTAALSFAAAPRLFRALPSPTAGSVFGPILEAFDALAFGAALASAVAGTARALLAPGGPAVETVAGPAILGVVAASFLHLRRVVAPRLTVVGPPSSAATPWSAEAKAEFESLHRAYVRRYASHLLLTAAALTLPALAG
jgi:hypothetical protein